ncbi:MAG: hypothetical protein A2284_12070 [Deltaproteobacteria bacterium RIFOXYA12_FULL_61_11]|nr:MAG: hypothetical protein A2284_12070 [Deltaproteobacteria bacterium RIFOXYA12_FULL_61_11]
MSFTSRGGEMGALGFINPLLLWLLPLVFLPLVIHLLQRRKVEEVFFPNLELVVLVRKELRRSITLQHLLILALKMLLVAAIVLAATRPVWRHEAKGEEDGSETDHFLLLDVSASMGYRRDGRTHFERAVEALQELISRTGPGHRFSLLPFARGLLVAPNGLREERYTLQRELQQLVPTQRSSDLGLALEQLGTALDRLEPAARCEVLVLTDFTGPGWTGPRLGAALDRLRRRAEVRLIDLSDGEALHNVTVREVRSRLDHTGLTLDLDLVNTFDDEDPGPVELWLNGRQVAAASLGPGQERLSYALSEQAVPVDQGPPPALGRIAAEVRFSDQAFPADNRHAFTIVRDPFLQVLILCDPGQHEATFYLERALNPEKNFGSLLLPNIVTTEQYEPADLRDADVYFLVGLRRLDPELTSLLTAEVEAGKPLFLTLGPQVEVDAYNLGLPIFPWHILGLVERDAPLPLSDKLGPEVDRRFGFEGLHLAAVGFRRYYSVTPLVEHASEVLLSLDNGAPLLLEATLGRGKVFLFCSALDDTWSSFPIKGSFLPLWHELVKGSVDAATAEATLSRTFDDELRLPLDGDGKSPSLRALEGGRDVRMQREGETAMLGFGELPGGHYLLLGPPPEEKPINLLALNYSPGEVELHRQVLEQDTGKSALAVQSGLDFSKNREQPLWPLLLLLALFFLVAEHLLVLRLP